MDARGEMDTIVACAVLHVQTVVGVLVLDSYSDKKSLLAHGIQQAVCFDKW